MALKGAEARWNRDDRKVARPSERTERRTFARAFYLPHKHMNPEQLSHKRHTLAHLLAAAVRKHHRDAKATIGPAVDNGFYYDFEFATPITEKEIEKLDKEMKKLLPKWTAFTHKEVSAEEAKTFFKDNPYKLELIEEIIARGEKITFYECGGFIDLCRGGHLGNPATEIDPESFKLSHIAGAYWRGDEKNTMLTRIYGLAFESKEALEAYAKQREEAEKRDHRKLGKELGIFAFDEDVGPGLPLWLPNGGAIVEALETLAKQTEFAYEYERVRTPHIAKESMYLTSGHLPYYQESMFPPMEYEGGKYYMKAMNCPHHHKIFAAEPKSYRDLPLRLAEYGSCYRHEKSGELFGLMRVRSLSMNDAHIYCTEEQFADEFKKVIDMYLAYFKIFGIDKYVMRLSKHSKEKLGAKYINEPELWLKTEDMVRKCLVEAGVNFVEAEDEGAFYGPKIDVQIWSAIGREFTLATNQVDFAVPARFGLTYTDKDGTRKTPLCIHRAPLSTHERFIGFLIEHYGGSFPLWLAPEQVHVVPVRETADAKAKEAHAALRAVGIRAKANLSNEGFGKKVRAAKDMKVPYTVIIGDKDIEAGMVTLESRDKGNLGQMGIEDVVAKIAEENAKRS
jgi:threonyl-tRNA synthetase